MTSRWARYRELEPRDRRLFREAWRTLCAARLRLRLTSFRSCVSWSARERGATTGNDVDLARVARAVRRASRAVPGARCLAQALAARVLLRRRGLDPELRLGGASGESGRFAAHAWLELGGRIAFGDPDPGRFTPFDDALVQRDAGVRNTTP